MKLKKFAKPMSVNTGAACIMVKAKIKMTVTTAKKAQAKNRYCSAFSFRCVLRDTKASSRLRGAVPLEALVWSCGVDATAVTPLSKIRHARPG